MVQEIKKGRPGPKVPRIFCSKAHKWLIPGSTVKLADLPMEDP